VTAVETLNSLSLASRSGANGCHAEDDDATAEPAPGRPTYWRARLPIFWPYDGEGMPPSDARRHTDSHGSSYQSELRSL